METISLKTFFYHFCKDVRKDKKFCFILGSGASKPSGIPTGGELVTDWMKELLNIYSPEEINEWQIKENILLPDLASNYPKIYDKRFALNKKDGYAFLETLIAGKDPSCGYSVLAQILDTTPHKIVITTNFDSLTEDALFIYTRTKPMVVVHESLADYITTAASRPTIVKIHRDLFFSPRNTQEQTSELALNFKKNLRAIFKDYAPLVIGYGGNDGSLMQFLEQLEENSGSMFWFYQGSSGKPNQRIQKLVENFSGFGVQIAGFDEFFIQLGNELHLELLDKKVIEVAQERTKVYREQIESITKSKIHDIATQEALTDIISRGEKDWWYYELKASAENDPDKRENIYQEGLKQLTESAELFNSYAIFLTSIRKNYDKAEEYRKKAIELEPRNTNYLSNYAAFLENIRKDYDKAKEFWKKSKDSSISGFSTYSKWIGPLAQAKDGTLYLAVGIALDPTVANNGVWIYKSNDGGRTWKKTIQPRQTAFGLPSGITVSTGNSHAYTDIQCPGPDGNLVYVTDGFDIFKSVDGGIIWVPLTNLFEKLRDKSPKAPVGYIVSISIGTIVGSSYTFAATSTFHGSHWGTSGNTGFNGGIYVLQESVVNNPWADMEVGDDRLNPFYTPTTSSNMDSIRVMVFPDFATTQGIMAVVSNYKAGTTLVTTKYGAGQWGNAAKDVLLKWNSGGRISPVNINSVLLGASIFLASDFNSNSSSTMIAFVGINPVVGNTVLGDVYRCTLGRATSSASALNINGGAGVGVSSMSGVGTTANAGIMISGYDSNNIGIPHVWASKDGGTTWTTTNNNPAAKRPTGSFSPLYDSVALSSCVVMPDFASSGKAIVGTHGNNCALSFTKDFGMTWNMTQRPNILRLTPSK